MNNLIAIGKITKPKGIKGEFRVYPYTSTEEKFEYLEMIFIDNKEYEVEKITFHKNIPILKLKGIESMNESESLRNKEIYVNKLDILDEEDEEYFVNDLIGYSVYEDDIEIGTVKNILTRTHQDLIEVTSTDNTQFFIPFVEEFVGLVDQENKIINVKLIEGMRE